MNLLTAAALTRLKGEMAKDGREPSSSSKGSFDASPNGRITGSGTGGKTKGNGFTDMKFYLFVFLGLRRVILINLYLNLCLSAKSVLEQFCVDLTARASEGLIDPVIGREKEVQRIIQILCRRTKNNPILLGEAGVGKTAIAEGLAISIAEAKAPGFLLVRTCI